MFFSEIHVRYCLVSNFEVFVNRYFISIFLFFNFLQAEKVALITGVTGQDGSYLSEFLLDKGYTVHGIMRRSSTPNTSNIKHLMNNENLKTRFFLHYADLTDAISLYKIVGKVNPDEIYNLAAQSDVGISFMMPAQTGDITGMGTLKILEANHEFGGKAKVYQASTSELFGSSKPPQSELTPFHPRSPYAVAKLYGYWIGVNYRESYKMFVSNGILFNHESPRRGSNFITRKITLGIASILSGQQKYLELGNLNSMRDWGFAPDYVECMWKILQQPEPGDYVIGTGKQYSVKNFINQALGYIGIELEWKGEGVSEEGIVKKMNDRWKNALTIGQTIIRVNPMFFRPAEVDSLLANPEKSLKQLQWQPRVNFEELVKIMVDADLKQAGIKPVGEGLDILSQRYGFIQSL